MRTLVTGGAGFIGSHLVARLLRQGDDVVVLDTLDPQVHGDQAPDLPAEIEFIEGDVGDPAVADRALAGVGRVVHLAAAVGVGQSMYEIERYVRQNTLATATFLERLVLRNPRPERLVVASSMSIYGEGEYVCEEHGAMAPHPRPEEQLLARRWEVSCPSCGAELRPIGTRETKPLLPTSIYAITKRDHEELCLVTGAAYAIPTVALRFFNVYGPGQALSNPYTGVAAIFASRLLNERAPVIFEDGRQSRDFIHVDDIVEGILLALESEQAAGRAVNLGTGRVTTVNDVAGALSDGLGVDIEPERTEQYRAGDIRHCYADPALAEELLGFRARVSLEDGMGELIKWLREQEAVDRVETATRELATRGLAR
ncbi:MAG: nucleoside-diphosphate-sugar epimerase [Actinobacteria bacterium 13_2_20CM_2_66_6]|nr:MAG: nucleoside-diphosphate-sugar epimerase [Actinobacteria bacterium 13_2_20CM_2_66_6]